MPTKKAGGKGEGSKAETDPELAGSNVLSVGEGVLLKWLFYHLEQANRVSFRVYLYNFSNVIPCMHVYLFSVFDLQLLLGDYDIVRRSSASHHA